VHGHSTDYSHCPRPLTMLSISDFQNILSIARYFLGQQRNKLSWYKNLINFMWPSVR